MSVDLEREKLSTLVASFMSYSAGHLPDDVKTRLAQMKEIESEGFAPEIYNVMQKNMELADSLKRPSCQDTGIPQFFCPRRIQVALHGHYRRFTHRCCQRSYIKSPVKT